MYRYGNKPELRLTPASLNLRASPMNESEPPNVQKAKAMYKKKTNYTHKKHIIQEFKKKSGA